MAWAQAADEDAAVEAFGAAVPEAPPAPPDLRISQPDAPVAALVLDDDRATLAADCAGRGVLIHASFAKFTLTGGCRSVTVLGRDDRIDAELAPGARIAIGGDAVTLRYSLAAPGAPPAISVTGDGSAAEAVVR